MQYLLMHKKTPVVQINIDDGVTTITGISEVFAPEHLPVGVKMLGGIIDRTALNKWWDGRSIPASRSGLRDALQVLGLSSSRQLLDKCFGLSLSDQYWINPKDNPLNWDDVNFFDNTFSDDVGNILFGQDKRGDINLISPCNTSDGWLKKKWIIADGKRVLVKGGSNPFQQEPLNEIVATTVMRRLGIPHVPYALTWEKDLPYSTCEDFITNNTDLVSAWNILQTRKKANDVSYYQHYLDCCEQLGIPDVQESLDQILVVDYIIANVDRHYNNFGAVRNAETLEWIGAAPIYDSGTSMWYNRLAFSDKDLESKPFRHSFEAQMELVSSFDWLDFDSLKDIGDEAYEIYSASPYIDDNRALHLCASLDRRCEQLEDIAQSMEEHSFYLK